MKKERSSAAVPDRAVRRQVRSYVIRGGRLTHAQKRALEELLPVYGIADGQEAIDLEKVFGNRRPVIMEIGFGNGEATWRMARERPDQNFLGVEVHRPGVGHLLLKLREHDIRNVRVACQDAVELLEWRIADSSLHGVRIYFPDPWPKKRHHKRRLVQAGFVGLLARRIRDGGILHLATDWAPYAGQMLDVLRRSDAFRNLSPHGDFCERPEWRPETRYERRGERLGHPVFDLVFERRARHSRGG